MSNSNTYGYVCDYATGIRLRPATREDWLRGRRDGERHTGAHRTPEFGERTVYVDGPEADPKGRAFFSGDRITAVYKGARISGQVLDLAEWKLLTGQEPEVGDHDLGVLLDADPEMVFRPIEHFGDLQHA